MVERVEDFWDSLMKWIYSTGRGIKRDGDDDDGELRRQVFSTFDPNSIRIGSPSLSIFAQSLQRQCVP